MRKLWYTDRVASREHWNMSSWTRVQRIFFSGSTINYPLQFGPLVLTEGKQRQCHSESETFFDKKQKAKVILRHKQPTTDTRMLNRKQMREKNFLLNDESSVKLFKRSTKNAWWIWYAYIHSGMHACSEKNLYLYPHEYEYLTQVQTCKLLVTNVNQLRLMRYMPFWGH